MRRLGIDGTSSQWQSWSHDVSGRARFGELGEGGQLRRTREVPERPSFLIQLGLEKSDHGIGAAGQAEDAGQIERCELATHVGRAETEANLTERACGIVEPLWRIEPEAADAD